MAQRRDDRAVYIISVAAELAGVHPQTLRIYERKGLLRPARTAGNTRRYSDRDIDRLRLIQELTQEHGINLAGVKMIMELQNEVERLRAQVRRMQRDPDRSGRDRATERQARRFELVPLDSVRIFPWQGRR
ncbi:MAG: helix-turn-helix transcriptional regulator [Actinomycetota bacterium]|nr:helix-turn-helix transcriptional regulator [Actinomycetota bacterium]